MNLIKDLYERFRPYDRISPLLVMRYTKFRFDDCVVIRDELMELRRIEKELLTPKRKKWERIK